MKEQLITFETAKLAKKKGFDIPVHYFVSDVSGYSANMNAVQDFNKEQASFYSAPTQSLLQKWLREKHNCVVFTKPWIGANFFISSDTFYSEIYLNQYRKGETELEDTYEEALEKGLQEALKLINN